jgi:hypothetical protein
VAETSLDLAAHALLEVVAHARWHADTEAGDAARVSKREHGEQDALTRARHLRELPSDRVNFVIPRNRVQVAGARGAIRRLGCARRGADAEGRSAERLDAEASHLQPLRPVVRIAGAMGKIWFAGVLALCACGEASFGVRAAPEMAAGRSGTDAAGVGSSGPRAGSGGQGGAHAGTGGEALAGDSGAPSSAGGPAGRPSVAGAPAEAGQGGEDYGPAGAAGAPSEGGSAGLSCAPLTQEEACGSRACGPADLGCGESGQCGECPPGKSCSESGACEAPTCDCAGFACGRLTGCEGPSLCGENQGACGVFELCFASGGGTACREPPFSLCSRHTPGQQETCCADRGPGCSIGYAECPTLYAVNLQTGEDCGTCLMNIGPDMDVEHHCGPGY